MRHLWKLVGESVRDLSLVRPGTTRGVFILGMHRSGTSALTGLLAERGLRLGSVDTWATPDHALPNPRGNLEDRRVRDIHEGLLDANGGSWDRPPEIARVPWLLRLRAAQVRRKLSRLPERWGVKDPRTLLCMDLWREMDADRVATLRHPAKVVESLLRRHPGRWQAAHWESVWVHYNRRLLELYREDRFPVVSFDWPADRYRAAIDAIAAVLGLARCGATFFDASFRRSSGRVRVARATLALHEELLEIAELEERRAASPQTRAPLAQGVAS